jgi:very-short-patch-repair endonuclease
MSNIFICKHCGKEMGVKQLGRHLWKIHGKKYEDYVKENLNDFASVGWQPCVICGTISKQKTCNRECFKKHCSNLKRGIIFGPMSDETKQKLSNDRKQKYANGWAPRIGKNHSEESKQKMSDTQTARLSDPTNHSFYGKHHTDETKEKISNTRIERGVAKGDKNGMYGKTHTPESIAKIFSHRKMNKLEKLVADELDRASIPYHFQYFIVENGICKSYDFKIKGKPIIIEVDGDFWHGNPNQTNHYKNVDGVRENDVVKTEMAIANGMRIVRLWESDIKKDPSIVLKYVI